jgi:hypothetical protein
MVFSVPRSPVEVDTPSCEGAVCGRLRSEDLARLDHDQDSERQLIQRHPFRHPHAFGLLLPEPFLHDQQGVLG